MAGMGVSFVGVPDLGDETRSTEDDDAPAQADAEESTAEQESDEQAADDTDTDAEADEAEAEEEYKSESKLGSYEQSVVEALKSNPSTKGYAKRVAKAFELSVTRRELLEEKDNELAAKEETVKELEARLQETAERVTVAPAGPLAHLADEQALADEVTKCVNFLKWVKITPDPASHYKDTETHTAEELVELYKDYALNVLGNQKEQADVIKRRQAVRAEVKTQRATLFDPKHADHQFLTELYRSDPRTRQDFDQLIADALRGRAIREAAAKAPAKASAAAPAKEVKKVSKADLPQPRSASTLPIRGGGQSNADTVKAKLASGGRVSFDEMADSGAMSRAA